MRQIQNFYPPRLHTPSTYKHLGQPQHIRLGQPSGWLVGWLVFILRLLMGIKSTISPPEGHIRRAKLWNYSDDTLP